MKPVLILLMMALGTSAAAQSPTADSIRKLTIELKTSTEDTLKVKALYKLSYYYLYSDPDSSLILARMAYDLSEKNNFLKGKARSLGQMAGAFNKMGNYSKALEYYLEMLKTLEEMNDLDAICSANLNIASVYSSKKEISKALEYAFRADSIARKNNFNDQVIYIDLNIGNMYTEKGVLDSALYFTNLALDSSISQDNNFVKGTAFNNLGNIYLQLGDNATAISNYRKAIGILKENSDFDNLAETFIGLARAFDNTGIKDSAFYYARYAYSLSTGNGFLRRSIDASALLSDLYKKTGRIDSAFAYQQGFISLKDSFDTEQKLKELHNLTLNEELRQEDIAKEKIRLRKDRKLKLELLFVGMLIPVFILLSAFISRKKVNRRLVELSGIFSLLFLFEYITLLLHPMVAESSGHSPIIEILIFVALAAILSPAHHKIEHWFVTHLTSRHHKSLREFEEKKRQKDETLSA